jgi:hypothetical protein
MRKTSNLKLATAKPQVIALLHRHLSNISDDRCRRRLNGLRLLSTIYGWPERTALDNQAGLIQDTSVET